MMEQKDIIDGNRFTNKGKHHPKFINRVGEKHITNEGYTIEIIEYFNTKSCTVKFEDGNIYKNIAYKRLTDKSFRNPLHLSVYSIGYLGIGDYKSSKEVVKNRAWRGMMSRCYSKEKYYSYKNCLVTEEWHNFQNFAKWHEENFNTEMMQGWHLDKDILIKGNKIYSPETCCFVPAEINMLFVKTNSIRGKYPIGVSKHKKRFKATVNKSNSYLHLGTFDTVEETFGVYKKVKEQYIKGIAEKWKDKITDQVYQALINYKVEVTD